MAEWEQTVYNLTSPEWPQAHFKTQIASDGKYYIVFQALDELLVFITGFDDDDELALADFVHKFLPILQNITKKVGKGKLTEASLIECYAKVVSALNVIVSNGVVHTLDQAELDLLLSMEDSKEKKSDKKDKK